MSSLRIEDDSEKGPVPRNAVSFIPNAALAVEWPPAGGRDRQTIRTVSGVAVPLSSSRPFPSLFEVADRDGASQGLSARRLSP